MKKLLLFPLFIFTLSACVSAPKGLERDRYAIRSLSQIQTEDYACRCKSVRLGGKVLAVTALKQQTKLEILSLPIAEYSAKPLLDGATNGRFIAYIQGFVDPESLKDQYVTVAGRLTMQEQGKIDEAPYHYPVVAVENYKRWTLMREYYYDPDDDYWGGFWGFSRSRWGLGGAFWRPEPRFRYGLY
ncbi:MULTISPECIES: Slp family lipoprotein [Pasteurellaceae]|uniref:Slp family lipoprotein n=1 Tax=Pasteurellaceae TaxID=712 RepID=UPI00356B4B06